MPPKQESVLDAILKHAAKPGISIIIDADTNSDSVRMGLPYTFEKKDKVLIIYIKNLKKEEESRVLVLIKEYFDKYGLVLNLTQDADLKKYIDYSNSNPYKHILDFYKDKISANDLDVLKMAFFLKNEKSKGRDIERYKQDIRERFGNRGTYIANLCSAGYFEKELKAASESMTVEKFDSFYKQSVGEEVIALFVHLGMTPAFLRNVIEDKSEKCRRYNREGFQILCYGWKNVDFLKRFLENNPDNSWNVDLKIRVRDGYDFNSSEIILDVIIQ